MSNTRETIRPDELTKEVTLEEMREKDKYREKLVKIKLELELKKHLAEKSGILRRIEQPKSINGFHKLKISSDEKALLTCLNFISTKAYRNNKGIHASFRSSSSERRFFLESKKSSELALTLRQELGIECTVYRKLTQDWRILINNNDKFRGWVKSCRQTKIACEKKNSTQPNTKMSYEALLEVLLPGALFSPDQSEIILQSDQQLANKMTLEIDNELLYTSNIKPEMRNEGLNKAQQSNDLSSSPHAMVNDLSSALLMNLDSQEATLSDDSRASIEEFDFFCSPINP